MEFVLDAEAVPAGHQEAAAFWGVSRKTLTRWKDAGRRAGDPCPYRTAPGQMVEWYQRVFSKAVPAAISQTLARLQPGPAAAVAAPVRKEVPLAASAAGEGPGMLARLEESERALHDRYIQSLQSPEVDEPTRRRYREEWQETLDLLGLAQQRAKKMGELVDPAEYDAAFTRLMATLPAAMLRAFPKSPPEGQSWTETVKAAVSAAFRRVPTELRTLLEAA